jgi:hypothetical protein
MRLVQETEESTSGVKTASALETGFGLQMTPIHTAQTPILSLCTLLTLGNGEARASAGVSPETAKRIMGENFLGEVEVARALGVKLTEKQRANVRVVPFSAKTLSECSTTHILFLGVERDRDGYPLTIRRLRDLFPPRGQPCFRSYPKPSQPSQGYADVATPELRWYLIAAGLREESRSQPYWRQKRFLQEHEYRERAVVYVYMVLLTFKARQRRLFEKDLVFCEDRGLDGAPVAAGYFAPEGLYVSDWWVDQDEHFGLVPARKPDFP